MLPLQYPATKAAPVVVPRLSTLPVHNIDSGVIPMPRGAPGAARTHDPQIKNLLFCPLNYGSMKGNRDKIIAGIIHNRFEVTVLLQFAFAPWLGMDEISLGIVSALSN